jgi:outer membrane protein
MIRYPFRLLHLLALSAVVALSAPAAGAQSLADALIAAYRNSNLLEQNRALLRADDEDVAAAVARLRPVINFVAGASYSGSQRGVTVDELTAQLSLSAEMTLFDFGETRLGIEAARETVMATREALIGVEQQVLFNAVQAFMNVRATTELLSLRQNNVRLIQQELRAAQDRFEVGEITRTDVAIAEARLAAARSNLAAAEGDLAVATRGIHRRDRPDAGPVAPAARAAGHRPQHGRGQGDRPAHPSRDPAGAAAGDGGGPERGPRPGLAARQAVSAGADLSVDQRGRDTSGLALRYSVPLYQGGALSAGQRQAAARRDAARAALHQTAVGVVQDAGNAWARLQVAGARIEASDRQITASRTAYDGVREEAALGARTTLDVLNAENELLEAQANRIISETDRQVAAYALLASMGLLTVTHLNLGIPTYDPSVYYDAVKNAPFRSPQGQQLDRVMNRLGRN